MTEPAAALLRESNPMLVFEEPNEQVSSVHRVMPWDEALRIRGAPNTIWVDNGPESISKALGRWAYENGVTLDFVRPGKSTDNAFAESFDGRLRDECLNTHWFLSLEDTRAKIEAWRRDYNESRPHTSFGWMTPVEYAAAAAKIAAE